MGHRSGHHLNDLVLANASLNDAFEAAGKGASPEGLYFFRLAASHYREACKLLDAGQKDADVAAFIGGLPKEAQDLFEKVKRSFTPFKGSFVEGKLKPVRNAVFHYGDLAEGEIQGALEELKENESLVSVEAATLRGLRMVWADEVALRLAFGHLEGIDEFQTLVQSSVI